MDIEEINIRCLTFFSFEYLQILNVNKTKKKTVSDSYLEAKKLVEELSNKCWQADSNGILTNNVVPLIRPLNSVL